MSFNTRQRRLKFIDTELRKNRHPSARELARLFEGVSSKTILRDIEHLRVDLGAPIAYDSAKKGFFYNGKPLDVSAFQVNERDFFTLYIAQKILEQYRGTSLYPVLQQTLNKLAGCIPGNHKLDFKLFTDRILIRSAPLADVKQEYVWDDLVEAVVHEKVVEFEHHNPFREKPTDWRVQPLLLLCEEGRWYLIALTDKGPRPLHFALWRIRALKVTKDYFEYPDSFRSETYLSRPVGSLEDAGKIQVLLRFKKHLSELLHEREWFPQQKVKQRNDGRLDLSFETTPHFRLMSLILNWGADVEVIRPASLRRELVEHIAAIQEVYR